MIHFVNNDNLYKEGSILSSKANPSEPLKVEKYNHRIYYCSVVGHPERKQLVFFERELAPRLD